MVEDIVIFVIIIVLTLRNDEIMQALSERIILGEGGYGVVYLGYMRATKVAIKYLNEVSTCNKIHQKHIL